MPSLRSWRNWPSDSAFAARKTFDDTEELLDPANRSSPLPSTTALQAAEKALLWLEALPDKGLVVFDSAVDIGLTRKWIVGTGGVRTIVTSVDQAFATLGPSVSVDVFRPEESLAFLREETGVDDDGNARRLAIAVGHLPVALAQTGHLVGLRGYPAVLRDLQNPARIQGLEAVPGPAISQWASAARSCSH
jgi:hypothetical protein